jgi:hypothetical protein
LDKDFIFVPSNTSQSYIPNNPEKFLNKFVKKHNISITVFEDAPVSLTKMRIRSSPNKNIKNLVKFSVTHPSAGELKGFKIDDPGLEFEYGENENSDSAAPSTHAESGAGAPSSSQKYESISKIIPKNNYSELEKNIDKIIANLGPIYQPDKITKNNDDSTTYIYNNINGRNLIFTFSPGADLSNYEKVFSVINTMCISNVVTSPLASNESRIALLVHGIRNNNENLVIKVLQQTHINIFDELHEVDGNVTCPIHEFIKNINNLSELIHAHVMYHVNFQTDITFTDELSKFKPLIKIKMFDYLMNYIRNPDTFYTLLTDILKYVITRDLVYEGKRIYKDITFQNSHDPRYKFFMNYVHKFVNKAIDDFKSVDYFTEVRK